MLITTSTLLAGSAVPVTVGVALLVAWLSTVGGTGGVISTTPVESTGSLYRPRLAKVWVQSSVLLSRTPLKSAFSELVWVADSATKRNWVVGVNVIP